MRPVVRGPRPVKNGEEVEYAAYADARGDLLERMGDYCSYCEMQLGASLAVEHVQPKSLNPGLELEWDNFLLGCTNCNSIKLNKPINLPDFYWPDLDNTFYVFRYLEGGYISINPDLSPAQKAKAKATINLTGLDRRNRTRSASDRRWLKRKEAWDKATMSKQILSNNEAAANGIIELITMSATSTGFFSVWMSVFTDDNRVRQRLMIAFRGTYANCEDETVER